MVKAEVKGGFSKTLGRLDSMRKRKQKKLPQILDKYGKKGVEALAAATPVDTGLTAASWGYTVTITENSAELAWYNTNVKQYVNIALIIQMGHGTRGGTWVEGRDYINPAIKPIFEEMARELWKEVTA